MGVLYVEGSMRTPRFNVHYDETARGEAWVTINGLAVGKVLPLEDAMVVANWLKKAIYDIETEVIGHQFVAHTGLAPDPQIGRDRG